jgi:methyl-accepting chemotaxis protein
MSDSKRGWTIRTKVVVSFTLVSLAAFAMGVFAITRIAAIQRNLVAVGEQGLPAVKSLARVSVLAERFRAAMALRVMSPDDASRADMDKLLDNAGADVRKALDLYAPLADTDEKQQLLAEVEAKWAALVRNGNAILEMARAGDAQGARTLLFTTFRAEIVAFRDALAADIGLVERNADDAVRTGAAIYRSAIIGVCAALAISVLLCLMAGYALILGVTRPIGRITGVMRRLADNDTAVTVFGAERGDEIGAMAGAIEIFRDRMIRGNDLAAAKAAEDAVRQARTVRVSGLVAAFEAGIADTVGIVAAAATDMQSSARSMSASAAETKARAGSVASAAQQSSAGVQTVAAAAEELTAAINEITRQVSRSAGTARQAIGKARRTDEIVAALADGATTIGAVVDMIAGIAGRTNLLALNASIEAARAGEAGKGFAVVAAEVKGLAAQTATATRDIAARISNLRGLTTEAVEAVRGIAATAEDVGAAFVAIASAVEQQGAATSEIAQTTQQTAVSTQHVADIMTVVTDVANGTEETAVRVLGAADGLARQAGVLRNEVDTFLAAVRAA